jgi:hypothetical protein
MPMKKHKPEQIVALPRQIEVETSKRETHFHRVSRFPAWCEYYSTGDQFWSGLYS